MMITGILKKPVLLTRKYFSKENLNITSMLFFYRFLSLFITSLFYFIGPIAGNLYFKFAIVISLLVEAYFFTRIYNNKNTTSRIKYFLIIMETLGLLVLLLFTGGLSSLFLWYFLNPVLLSITLQPFYFSWIVLLIFTAPVFFFSRFNFLPVMGFKTELPGSTFFILVFILVALAAQLYSYLIKKLSKQTQSLKEYINDLNELYESTEVFSQHNDIQASINIFASYAKKLTDASKIIISIEKEFENKKKSYFTARGVKSFLPDEKWRHYLNEVYMELNNTDEKNFWVSKIQGEDAVYNMISVRISSQTNIFGILSAFYNNKIEYDEKILPTLFLLSNLCALNLEKHNLELLEEEIIIREEKNRIAGEIHDNVNQELFSIVCGLGLLDKNENLNNYQHKKIQILLNTAQRSIRQLRYSIYNLSSTKKNKKPFIIDIKRYLDDLSSISNIKINYKFKGQISAINCFYRKCLYRIIREASSNAIKHSGCTEIDVNFTVNREWLILSVADNGYGFDIDSATKENRNGLGLINIKELVRNMNGTVIFRSETNKGTDILCQIPFGIPDGKSQIKESQYA